MINTHGHIGKIKIHSLSDTDNFNITGTANISDFSDYLMFKKYGLNNLYGDLNFNWIKSTVLNEFSADIILSEGILLKNKFSGFEGNITGEITNSQFSGKSSGILNGWEYKSYNWESIYVNVDLINENLTYFKLKSIKNYNVTLDTLSLYKFLLFLVMKIVGNLTYNLHNDLIERTSQLFTFYA